MPRAWRSSRISFSKNRKISVIHAIFTQIHKKDLRRTSWSNVLRNHIAGRRGKLLDAVLKKKEVYRWQQLDAFLSVLSSNVRKESISLCPITWKKVLVDPDSSMPYAISVCLARSSAESTGCSMRSIVRKAARLAVYDVMMISTKNHHAPPMTRPATDLSTYQVQ